MVSSAQPLIVSCCLADATTIVTVILIKSKQYQLLASKTYSKYSRFSRIRNHFSIFRSQKVSCLKRPFHDQGQSFLYISTIKSNQVKVCDSTVHACILNNTGNIVQCKLYSTMF